ncbi:hypothetical protein O181_093577 [Austropuccinia psidii MF-1]|uniref:Uncharacterized protein n=1 Tax=Austropuccinia psidii MF-1 TaxID=1389203 RepID=A0A9Q3J1R2_9BASI|nr:hypothetical protein [Austropuccinia psidii MF-1]
MNPDGRRLCLPIFSPQKVGWRENPPSGMETCAVSKLEYLKELPVEKEPSFNNQEISEEHPHQVFKEEEIMESEYEKEIKGKDLKHQDHSLVQEESIESTSKSKKSEELNKILEYIRKNQSTNGNDYGQATFKKASRKPNIKNNGNKGKSLLPQEVTSPPILFSKLLKPEASLKRDNIEIQKLQLFPSNKVNIDPRLIMENKDIIKQNLNKSKIEIRKSEQELAKELTQEPKEESDTYLPKENNLFHIHTSNKDPTFPEYSQHLNNFNPSRELNKEIKSENKAIKQEVTVEKGREITRNEDPINLKPRDFTKTRNPIEQ